jgi:serine-type D-Ala-D-Ala carboxypeptidase/endopeptidase
MKAKDAFPAKPLAEAARSVAKDTKQGTIATGEWRDGKASHSMAGKAGPKSVPPERVIYEIGSISKVFTGLLLAQSVIEKKVRLDSTLKELLGPDQTFADPRVGAITLLQLVTHTSGLPRLAGNHADHATPGDPYAKYDRAALAECLASTKLDGDGPFLESYSNLGFGLLGEILSRVHEKTWEELVREKITAPLGMRDTVVTLDAEQTARFIQPYAGKEKKLPWTFTAMAGAGALRSTTADMILFGRALLQPEGTPLKDAAVAMLTKPQVSDGGCGLAIRIGKLDGQRVWEHDGGTGGFRSSLQVFPDAGVVRVVLVNDAAMPSGKVLAAARLKAAKNTAMQEAPPLSAAALAEFTGVYDLDKQARFTCLIRGGRLAIQLTGQSFLDAFPLKERDRFFLKAVDAEFQFHRLDEKIDSLTLHQNGRELTARKSAKTAPAYIFRTKAELKELEGSYLMLGGAEFTIEPRNGVIFAKLTDQEFVPVFESRKDWFVYDVVDASLEFLRDEKGQIAALRLHQDGLIQMAVKKPGKK